MSEAVDRVITDIRNRGFAVYLGGSRRMAELHPADVQITVATDHDYYATYSESLFEYLDKSQDWELSIDPVYAPYPCDDEVVKIMVHLDLDIQFVLRKDAEFYRSVFEAIPPDFYTTYLWKSSIHCTNPKAIMPTFNALFAVAHAQGGCAPASVSTPVPRDPLKAYEYAMRGIK
jgi:acetolactate synthase regulatory subunit